MFPSLEWRYSDIVWNGRRIPGSLDWVDIQIPRLPIDLRIGSRHPRTSPSGQSRVHGD